MSFDEPQILDEGFQVEKYWRIIKPKLHWPIALAIVFTLVVFIKDSLKQPYFKASGLLMIEPERDIINLTNRYGFSDYRNEYFNTQLRILRSRSLAKKVYEEIGEYPGGISISPIEMTRLVNIGCINPDPEKAALIINTLFDKYIEFNALIKTTSSREISTSIGKQISELRDRLSQKQEELQKYSKKKDLYFLSRRDSTVVENFSDLNRAYTQAQISRVNKEAIYMEVKGMKFEDFPMIKNSSLISNLKGSYSKLEAEYIKKSQIYKKNYPEMVQIRSQLDSQLESINKETRALAVKILKEARTEYSSAKKEEDSLKDLLNKQKGEMSTSATDAIYYNSLNVEVANMNTLLNYLVRRQKESLLSSEMESLQTNNIRVVDKAEVPKRPISSRRSNALVFAFIFGAGLGLGLILLVDFLDRTLRTPEDVKTYLNIPALGIVPSSEGKSGLNYYSYHYGSKKKAISKGTVKNIELINFRDPECPFAEHYRSIRTSIQLSTPKSPPRVISISSAMPGEGKTTTVVNLAVSFAKLGKKVVIIDADLRKPRIHKIFKLKNTLGLSSFLAGRAKVSDILQKTHINNVFVATSGPIPPNPAELIDSEVMSTMLKKILEKVDFVFIDTPPLIGIVDPILVGKHSDGLILVTWGGKTRIDNVKKAKEEIDRFGIRLIGLVLNKIDFKRSEYSYNYNYSYNYSYKYKEEDYS